MPEADVERCLLETVETSVTLYRGQLVNRDGRQAADLIATLRRQVDLWKGAADLKDRQRQSAEARLSEVEAELRALYTAYVRTLEAGRERILALGGDCDPVDVMKAGDPALIRASAALSPEEPRLVNESRDGGRKKGITERVEEQVRLGRAKALSRDGEQGEGPTPFGPGARAGWGMAAHTPDSGAERGWRDIASAPKTKADFTGGTADFLAWCPDPTAPQGGDRRIVWWEPQMKGGKGCWWGDRELEEHPTLWMPLPTPPGEQEAALSARDEGERDG